MSKISPLTTEDISIVNVGDKLCRLSDSRLFPMKEGTILTITELFVDPFGRPSVRADYIDSTGTKQSVPINKSIKYYGLVDPETNDDLFLKELY